MQKPILNQSTVNHPISNQPTLKQSVLHTSELCSSAVKNSLIQRWQTLCNELAASSAASLLAVSKYAPDEAVQLLIDAGQTCFGESRPQNLRDRAKRWPHCAWHMIGPVQKNKAKYIGRHAAMWHSCDNIDTAIAVARHVKDRTLPVLIQVNIDAVPHQRGIPGDAVEDFAEALAEVDGLQLAGLMCMAAKNADARHSFQQLRNLRDELFGGRLVESGMGELCVGELCMGMSADYHIAIAEGASMIRLGSTLFGDWDVRPR